MKSPAARRDEILTDELTKAASNGAAICNAYVETARKLLAEHPDMSADQKFAHHGALKYAVQTHQTNTKQDCSNVLGELARLFRT
jgi:hypothetical protein